MVKMKVYYCDDIDYMLRPRTPSIEQFKKHWHKLPFDLEGETFDDIYCKLNMLNLPSEQMKALRELAKKVKHTSMSVGDIIEVDGTFYMCDIVGWRKIEKIERKDD